MMGMRRAAWTAMVVVVGMLVVLSSLPACDGAIVTRFCDDSCAATNCGFNPQTIVYSSSRDAGTVCFIDAGTGQFTTVDCKEPGNPNSAWAVRLSSDSQCANFDDEVFGVGLECGRSVEISTGLDQRGFLVDCAGGAATLVAGVGTVGLALVSALLLVL